MATRFFSPEVNQPGQEVNHLPPTSAEVNKECSCTCTHPLCSHSVDMENFTFLHFLLEMFCQTCCLHMSMKPAVSSVISVPTYQHCITAQKMVIIVFSAVTTQISIYMLLLVQNLPRFLASFFKPFFLSRLATLSKLPPETQCNICRAKQMTTQAIPHYSSVICLLPTD